MSEGSLAIQFPATDDAFRAEYARIRQWLDERGVPEKTHYDAELVFEEIVTNICNYAFEAPENHTISVDVSVTTERVELRFKDDGVPFDPVSRENPTLPSSIETAKVGGLGLMLVKKASSDMRYKRTEDGQNQLVVGLSIE